MKLSYNAVNANSGFLFCKCSALGAGTSFTVLARLGAFSKNEGKEYRFNISANAALVTIFFMADYIRC